MAALRMMLEFGSADQKRKAMAEIERIGLPGSTKRKEGTAEVEALVEVQSEAVDSDEDDSSSGSSV